MLTFQSMKKRDYLKLQGSTAIGYTLDDLKGIRPTLCQHKINMELNAKIDCTKESASIYFGDVSHEFNFSKFRRQPHDKELPSKAELLDNLV